MSSLGESAAKQRPTRHVRRRLFIGLAVVIVGGGAIYWFVASSREEDNPNGHAVAGRKPVSNSKEPCAANLRKIVLALHQYHDKYRALPPSYSTDKQGNRMHSWRVLLLPFLGEKELYAAYDLKEPWNGPNNRQLASRIPAVYCCPGDREKAATDTSYTAIVGPITNWPEHQRGTFGMMTKGPSNCVALVETTNSGIHWMQPADIPWSPRIRKDLISRVLTAHDDGANVAFFDASVHFLRPAIDEWLFGQLLTRGSFSYFGDDSDNAIGQFRDLVDAGSLSQTDVLPFTTGKISAGRNYVYCATVQLAWDQWRDELGVETITFEGERIFSDHMNRRRFPRSDLSPNHYVALAGKNIAARIKTEMDRKFPDANVNIPADNQRAMFAYLSKNLPFEKKFGILTKPLSFHAATGNVNVTSFGIESTTEDDVERFKDQIRILDYRNSNDFVIQLRTESDDILLAKTDPSNTLQETIDSIVERIRRAEKTYRRNSLEPEDQLIVPMISISVDRDYAEMTHKKILETDDALIESRQVIRFLLNESGARLQSSYVAALLPADAQVEEKKPRIMIFDKPFLIYLKEKKATQPYFVMWVETSELLSRFRPANND